MLNNIWKYKYFIFLIVLGLTPIIWFYNRPGILINGSDTNFPLNPLIWFERRFFVWNGVANAGSDFSSSIAGIFFHLIQVVPFTLGLGLQNTEIISLVFWFSMIVFSSYIFSGILLGKKIMPRLVLVCIYTFNIYLFNSWENVKVANLALVATLPLLIWIFWSYLERKIDFGRLLLYSCLTGILASGAGINPAYFATLVGGLLLAFVVKIVINNKKDIKQILVAFFGILIPLVLINLFWILPTLNYLFLSDSSIKNISDIGFTNWLDSLSENTSLFNVLRLQGAWDWYANDDAGAPLYIPYAPNYFQKLPFIAFSALLSGLAFLSLIIRKKNIGGKYFFLTLLLVIGVFLGAGSHAPTGELYQLMVAKIPFFSFFRSPWYIFTPFVVLAISSLVALFFSWFGEKINKKWSLIFIVIFIASNFLYAYPLVTGKIFRPASADNFLISFPKYVFTAGDWATKNVSGRIIGYPDDEIERFDWGYTGIESILNLVSSVETVFSSLSQANFGFNSVSKEFFLALKKDQVETALKLSGRMNVEYILNKTDQKTLAPKLPDKVVSLIATDFGLWSFYKIPDNYYIPKVYSSNSLFYSYPAGDNSDNLAVIGARDLLVNPLDSVVNRIPDVRKEAGIIVGTLNSQSEDKDTYLSSLSRQLNSLRARDLSIVKYSFSVPEDGVYTPAFESYHLKDFGIDPRSLDITLDDRKTSWSMVSQSDYTYFEPITLTKGDHFVTININSSNDLVGSNLNSLEDFTETSEGVFELKEIDGIRFLSINNTGNESESKAVFKVNNFDWMNPYVFELRHASIHGEHPIVRIVQKNQNSDIKTQIEKIPLSNETLDPNVYSFYFDPVSTPSEITVELVAKLADDPYGTKVYFGDLSLRKVFTNRLMFVKNSNPKNIETVDVSFQKNSPISYSVDVKNALAPHIIVFSENYSSAWQVSIADSQGNNLPIRPFHFSVNGFANAWYLEGTPKDYKMTITFKNQWLIVVGGIISVTTFLACATYLVTKRRTNARN